MRTEVAEDPLSCELDAMLSARSAVEAVLPAARSGHENCGTQRTVPTLHGNPRRRAGHCTFVHDGDRRSVALPPLTRADLAAPAVGGSIDVQGRILKAGDADVRRSLCEAASGLMTRFKGTDKVKNWGQAIAKRSCHRKACVAVARKLAMIMHAIWSDGTFYVGDSAANRSDAAQRARRKDRRLLGRVDERCNGS